MQSIGVVSTKQWRRRRSVARNIVTAHAIWLSVRCGIAGLTVATVMQLFGEVRSWWLFAAVPAAVLGGLAFGMPIGAWSVTRTRDMSFPVIQRFVITPLFLFGGAFFPVTQMPVAVRWLAYISPLWHSVQLCRGWATDISFSAVDYLQPWGVFVVVGACRRLGHDPLYKATVVRMINDLSLFRIVPPVVRRARRPHRMVERQIWCYRRTWPILLSGFFEPLFYLLSIRVGLSSLVGTIKVGNTVLSPIPSSSRRR